MSITPEQARELLDGATPGPWRSEYDNEIIETNTSIVLYNTDGDVSWGHNIEHDVPLIAAAPDLAQTIAGMTEQWRHEAWHDRGDGVGPWRSLGWPHDDGWRNTRESADFDLEQADGTFKHRLVRRLVGPVEVVDGE